jgi:hypothetical protein
MRVALALSVALLALAACREDDTAAQSSAPEGRQQAARAAAETAIKGRLRAQAVTLRGVQVFAQALPDTVAVCGRSSATGAAGNPFLPYVAVVSFEGEAPRVSNFVLGASGPEASRVFVEMVDRCFDGGGPATARVMARSFPPLPVPGPVPGAPIAEAEPGTETAAAAAEPPRPTNTVTVSARSAANLRSAARGGEVIRTLPASSTLEVIGEAPGGWYQVGQAGSAMGWVHASVLETPAR